MIFTSKTPWIAGAGLCNEEAVRAVVTEGPARIEELMKLGMHFDERELENGLRELDLGREGGHSKRRVLHFQDFTGWKSSELWSRKFTHSSITVLENHMAVDFMTTGKLGYAMQDCCVGVYVLDEESGEVETLRSDINVLATGGCGKVYSIHDQPGYRHRRWSGDGMARERIDCEHGVHPVPSDLPLPCGGKVISHFGGRSRRREVFSSMRSSAASWSNIIRKGTRSPRHRGARHRCGNETNGKQVRVSLISRTNRRSS